MDARISAARAGTKNPESVWSRMLRASPLLLVFAAAVVYMGPQHYPDVNPAIDASQKGYLEDAGGVPVKMNYTGFQGFDFFVRMYVASFTPGMAGLDDSGIYFPKNAEHGSIYAPQRLLSIAFLAEVTSINAIWTIESCRKGNAGTVAKLGLIFGILMQLAGMGHLEQLYNFITYIVMRPLKYSTTSTRHIPSYYAQTLLPTLAIGYVLPTILSYWPTFSLNTLQSWNFVWQLWPIWIVLFHQIFSLPLRLSSTTPTSKAQVIQSSKNNLFYLRLTYLFSALVSAAGFTYVRHVSPIPLSQLFFSGTADPFWEWTSMTSGIGLFLKYDYAFGFLGMTVWILLFFGDLKRMGKMETSWGIIGAVVVGVTAAAGPGAMVALLWWWREEILAAMDGEEGKAE